MCGRGEKQKRKTGTEGKENPSEIERHVTQRRKSGRFMYRERDRSTKGERESKGEEGSVRIRLEGRQKMQLSDTPLT